MAAQTRQYLSKQYQILTVIQLFEVPLYKKFKLVIDLQNIQEYKSDMHDISLEHGTKPELESFYNIWTTCVHELDQIKSLVEGSAVSLEKKYGEFDEIYRTLEKRTALLSSVYSGINSIKGMEYVLKLKSLISGYRKKYTGEGISFSTISYLIENIGALMNESVENFPEISHDYNRINQEERKKAGDKVSDMQYKWASFRRNGSWFIKKFRVIEIIEASPEHFTESMEKPFSVLYADKFLNPDDLLAWKGSSLPNYFLIIDGRAYPADSLNKRIFSRGDIVSGRIEPFKMNVTSPLTPGRVRLFGKNHIYLY